MDNEKIIQKLENTNSVEIAKSAKHKISFSSTSSSPRSSIDIEKDQLILETKHLEEAQAQAQAQDQDQAQALDLEAKHKESASISSQGSSAISNTMIVQGGSYDPNRIPASVFTSKPGTPMEWSVASNESLFSIHMGNTSFSRDHVFMLYRSGEMPKFDFDQPMNPFSGANTPPIPPEYVDRRSTEIANYNINSKLSDRGMILHEEEELPVFDNRKSVSVQPEKIVFPDKNVSNHVEEFRNSVSSTHSFQFPLLEVGGTSMKGGIDNMHSPRRAGHENGEQQQQAKSILSAEPEPQPQAATTTKRSNWLSFFSCCSPPPAAN